MPPGARCAARLQSQRSVLRVEPRNSHSGGGPHGTVLTRRRDNTLARRSGRAVMLRFATPSTLVRLQPSPPRPPRDESAEVQREPDPVSAVEVRVLARGG